MNRQQYNDYRDWPLPDDEDGADEGYLVEYLDGGKPNHQNHTGYISWSPKEQFDAAYRPTDGLTFGLAIEALKRGERVARTGWNGKGMWVAISCDGSRNVPTNQFWSNHAAAFAESQGGFAEVQPCLIMKNAQGKIQMGWAATQSDMLAEDWMILPDLVLEQWIHIKNTMCASHLMKNQVAGW